MGLNDTYDGDIVFAGVRNMPPVGKRVCYYTNESFADRDADGEVRYRILFVTENKAGYADNFPVTFPTLNLAQERVDLLNKGLNHTRDDMLNIVANSKRVGT